MLNLTLTITAAPELLAAMKGFTSAITATKVVTIPEYNSDFTAHKASKEQSAVQIPQAKGVSGAIYPVQTQQQSAIQSPQIQNQALVQTVPTQGASVSTSAQSYTMEQLAVAATQLVDTGHRAELVGLLSSFGVQALTALSKEQYGAFATQLRALGGRI